MRVHTELLLLHPDRSRQPNGTRRWLEPRQVDSHLHVALHNDADFQRVARRVARRWIGLVFGGGAARGFTHIGVARALREAGIPIDVVGGTSIGSLMAGMFALGMTPQAILQNGKKVFANFLDYTLPLVSIAAGKRITDKLRDVFGETEIEDLWMPFFCVSTNVTRAEMVIHRRGVLRRAIRSSLSLPGVFPPVIEGDDVLVDGSIFDNLPIDIMRDLCHGGFVIAADIGDEIRAPRRYTYDDHISGWGLLVNRLNPFRRSRMRAPSLIKLMLRLTLIGSMRNKQANIEKADIYINPPVSHFGLFQGDAAEQMVEIGYDTAKAKIDEWKRVLKL